MTLVPVAELGLTDALVSGEGRVTSELDATVQLLREHLDAGFYLEQYPDVASAGLDPAEHYLLYGADEGRDPSMLFSTSTYKASHESELHGVNPYVHFLSKKRTPLLKFRDFFDDQFYLVTNLDVAEAGKNPFQHYLENGAQEGRDPNRWFSTRQYLAYSAETTDINPLKHYLTLNYDEAYALREADLKSSHAVKVIEPKDDINPALVAGLQTSKKKRSVMQPAYTLHDQNTRSGEAVISCIFGSRHTLGVNTTYFDQQIVFADTPIDLPNWEFRPVLGWYKNPKIGVLFHKYYLANFLPLGTKIIWTDTRVSVQQHIIQEMMNDLDKSDLCVFKHYERDCVHDEVDGVLAGRRADLETCDAYRAYLNDIAFPRKGGLFETGLMGYRVTPEVRKTFSLVFGLSQRRIHRDQLTLPVALRARPLNYKVFRDGEVNLRNAPGVFVHNW